MAQPGRASTAGVEMKSLVFFNDDGGRRAATTSEGAGCAREREEVYVVLHEEGIRRTRVQRKGWTRQSCIVVTLLFVLVCVVASVVAVAMYISDQAGGTSYFAGESGTFYCAGGLSDAECAAEASAAAARAATSSTQPRVAVVLGNGCFWERQYAYAMLEYTDSLFQRSLYNLTARAGYAGALGVGDDGRVCYHHLGGDQSDVYSTLGHAEGVRVWLDTATTATDTDTDTDGGGVNVTEAQFVLLAQDFLDSFSYVSSKGGNSRPDAGDRGAEYRSFLVLPGGMTSRFYKIVQDLNAAKAHPLDLVAGSASDGDDFNTVFIYDSDDGYAFYDAEQYHQFHSNFFGAAYPSWYLDLNEQYASAGLLVDTGCPAGSHWLRRQR